MTEEALKEGQRLSSLVKDLERTLEFFREIEDDDCQEKVAEFLTGARMIPNKKQMSVVMRDAVIESCNLCISQAQEKFNNL